VGSGWQYRSLHSSDGSWLSRTFTKSCRRQGFTNSTGSSNLSCSTNQSLSFRAYRRIAGKAGVCAAFATKLFAVSEMVEAKIKEIRDYHRPAPPRGGTEEI